MVRDLSKPISQYHALAGNSDCVEARGAYRQRISKSPRLVSKLVIVRLLYMIRHTRRRIGNTRKSNEKNRREGEYGSLDLYMGHHMSSLLSGYPRFMTSASFLFATVAEALPLLAKTDRRVVFATYPNQSLVAPGGSISVNKQGVVVRLVRVLHSRIRRGCGSCWTS